MGFGEKLRQAAAGVVNKAIPRPGGDPGGVPARGVVVELVQGPFGNRDSHVRWNAVTLDLRRADQGPNEPVARIQCHLGTGAWLDLQVGQDVPVRVDPASGVIVGFDCEQHEDEVDERRRAPSPPMPDMAPDAASMQPVEGVSFELWVATLARIAKQMVPPAAQDGFAAAQGVPAGRWLAISSAWQMRANTDWKLGAQFGTAYQAEISRL